MLTSIFYVLFTACGSQSSKGQANAKCLDYRAEQKKANHGSHKFNSQARQGNMGN